MSTKTFNFFVDNKYKKVGWVSVQAGAPVHGESVQDEPVWGLRDP
jgi:hypothetical protein